MAHGGPIIIATGTSSLAKAMAETKATLNSSARADWRFDSSKGNPVMQATLTRGWREDDGTVTEEGAADTVVIELESTRTGQRMCEIELKGFHSDEEAFTDGMRAWALAVRGGIAAGENT